MDHYRTSDTFILSSALQNYLRTVEGPQADIFDFVVEDSSGRTIDEFSEQHWMRYLFLPEIEVLSDRCGFALDAAFEWMTFEPPDLGSWYVVVVAVAV